MKMNKIKKAVCLFLVLLSVVQSLWIKLDFYTQSISPNREIAQAEELEKLRENGVRAGTYSVKLVYADGEQVIEEIILLTIKDEHTIIRDEIAIDAHDATIDLKRLLEMTSDKWIEITNARAWNVNTQEMVNITGVNSSQVIPQKGTYQVYFVTLNNIQTSVNITVVSNAVDPDYFSNQKNAVWTNDYYPEERLFLSTLMNIILHVVSFLLILVILIPFMFLLVEYLVTSKIVQQIIRIITR